MPHATRSILPRPLRLRLDGHTPRTWIEGDPITTQLFNALSIVFPRGEKMFVDAVRAHKEHVTDPVLVQAVRDFIGQEVNHSRAHVEFNEWLASLGLPIAEFEAEIEARMKRTEALSPIRRLGATCALEHFTALFAIALLSHPELLEAMHEDVRALWLWHAIEELEHKSVAFDVFEASGGSHRTRVQMMMLATVTFLSRVARRHRRLMKEEGLLADRRGRLRSAWRMYGPGGVLAGALPNYLAYYRRDFHPTQIEDAALLEAGRAMLDALLARDGNALKMAS
jgi:predicted metal-dependent hydrolase